MEKEAREKEAIRAVIFGENKLHDVASKFDIDPGTLSRLVKGARLGFELAKETNPDQSNLTNELQQLQQENARLQSELESLRASGTSGDPITCPGLVYLTRAVAAGKADASCSDVRAEWEKLTNILAEKDQEILLIKKRAYALMKRYNHLERASNKLRKALIWGEKQGVVEFKDYQKFQELIDAAG